MALFSTPPFTPDQFHLAMTCLAPGGFYLLLLVKSKNLPNFNGANIYFQWQCEQVL